LGINVGLNPQLKVLLIDLEGTDNEARGEEGAAFENKAALFALASADILIVNMWTNEVGRFTAACIGLLKTVFSMNMKLFNQSLRHEILFVFRDFNELTDRIDVLKQQMIKSMERFWDEIKRPVSHQQLSVSECFNFKFYALASKEYMPDEFLAGVEDLRRLFTDASREDFLFSRSMNDVPLDGLAVYYSDLWSLITSEKDLNIPSQKALLSNFRCNELMTEACESFAEQMQSIGALVAGGVVHDLRERVLGLTTAALELYDIRAQHYLKETYLEVRGELNKTLFDAAKELFYTQLSKLTAVCLDQFKTDFLSHLDKKLPTDEFKALSSSALRRTMEYFNSVAEASLLPDSGWSYQRILDDLRMQLLGKIEEESEHQFSLLESELSEYFAGKFIQTVNKTLETIVTDDLWDVLFRHQAKSMEFIEDRICSVMLGLNKLSESKQLIERTRQTCYDAIKERVKHHNKTLTDRIVRHFNCWFTKDSYGVPRTWANTDIPLAFREAKQRALEVVEVFRYLKLLPTWAIPRKV
jgi:hypothetical protein